ncbi:glycosyltransferase [Cobetia amphilecti]|uniref:Glycosyltransferase n=1 Tax=Cobetia amphilecti TaxID=1055104 RepID=A0AAP4X0D3_9GAMM|nr:glycosyltransferase [Cobetia amphilecti]MDO6670838.1 glycosyltransferase [Cobetia amphilecti]
MKISFFIGTMHNGGAERQIIYTANKLSELGYRVEIATLKKGSAYSDLLSEDVSVMTFESKNGLFSILKAALYYYKSKPAVIVNFLYHATLIGRLIGISLNIPVITSYRNTSYGGKLRDFLVKVTSPLDSMTLSNSKAAGNSLCFKKSSKEILVIPNYYLDNGLGKVQSPKNKESTFNWCYVGRLTEQKNIEQLLYAFRDFSYLVTKNTKLFLLGDGNQKKYLQDLAAELNVAENVFFLGHSYNVKEQLNKADAFILPSLREGMPNSLMEAMYNCLPAIVTPVGAIPDMIANGETGFISKGFGYKDIAQSMSELHALDVNCRLAMGVAAKEFIITYCDSNAITQSWSNAIVSVARKACNEKI